MFRYHRYMQHKDLFAVEVKHHPSCLRSFHTAFTNFERGINRAGDPKRTEQEDIAAAYEKAINFVQEHVQNHVIQWNEVQGLTSFRLLY